MKLFLGLLIFISNSANAATLNWNCKGHWIFESYTLNPAVEISAVVQTSSEVDKVLPLTVSAGGLELSGTAILRPPYDIQLQNAERTVSIQGTMKVSVEGASTRLSVLLNGSTPMGAQMTGIMACLPKSFASPKKSE